jgi:hypothetical protein
MIEELNARFVNRNKIDQEQCQEDLLKIRSSNQKNALRNLLHL